MKNRSISIAVLSLAATVLSFACGPHDHSDNNNDNGPTCGRNQYYNENCDSCLDYGEDCDGGDGGNAGTGSGGSGSTAGTAGRGGTAGNAGTAGTGGTANSCPAAPNANGRDLAVPGYYQQNSNWCWAATITMVSQFYGKQISECVLASAAVGLQPPAYADYMCCYAQYAGEPACNQPAPVNLMSTVLNQLGVHHRLTGKLSENALAYELSQGRPVILSYQGSFIGHVIVVDGYNPLGNGHFEFEVLDPYFGPNIFSYEDIQAYAPEAGGAIWNVTFTQMTTGAATCSL